MIAAALIAGCAPIERTSTPVMEAPASHVASASAVPMTGTRAPTLDGVDYAHPEAHLALPPFIGNEATVRAIARSLPDGPAEVRLGALRHWLHGRLRYEDKDAYRWRTIDEMLADGTYGGCADEAVLFGSVARAAGIPTIWVKSLDADFIREFVAKRGDVQSWRGHVFLEVFVDGAWRLLDASGGSLYRDYDTHARILPTDRWAYDKGDDPHAMIMSTQWEDWRAQTSSYLTGFDVKLLPIGPDAGVDLPEPVDPNDLYIVANSPLWQRMKEHATAADRRVRWSFNDDFDRLMPKSKGATLFVLVVGDKLVLPERYWPELVGVAIDAFRKKTAGQTKLELVHDAPDGTHVVVLWAKTTDDALAMVDGFDMKPR